MTDPTADVTISEKTHSVDLADFYAIICHALRDQLNDSAHHERQEWSDENERQAVLEEDMRFSFLMRELRDACLDVASWSDEGTTDD
jgi:hypothetical protein